MFDFAWSEIMVIGVVAMIMIGPKDLPKTMKTVTGMIKKARKMASEFQTHVDEMIREADLTEVKESLNEIRNFDYKGTVQQAVDPDGTLREAFRDPLPQSPSHSPTTAVADRDVAVLERPADADSVGPSPFNGHDAHMAAALAPEADAAPAFIPPRYANPRARPAFIPPGMPEPRE
jgi:sec-independent protein translocase protein TatB